MDESICRTCLKEKNVTQMQSIFAAKIINNELVKFSTMVSLCTGVEISPYDNLSDLICRPCINAVTNAFEYRTQCWNVQKILLGKSFEAYKIQNLKEFSVPLQTDTHEDNNIDPLITDEEEEEEEPLQTEKENKSKDLGIILHASNEKEMNAKIDEHIEVTVDKTCYRGKRYKCRHCEQIYIVRYLMVQHLEKIHKFSIKPNTSIKCKICLKTFISHRKRDSHVRTHNVKLAVCHYCGKSMRAERLAEHTRRHTGEKPFKCDTCDFRAAQLSSLKKHKLTHTGEKPVICHICGRSFRTASQRANHIRTHSEERPFKCIVCGSAFKKKDLLKGHMLIHQPTKWYECKVCGKKMAQKAPLRMHMKQHTGERPHKCSECGKGFIQRHCWRTHMKNHHNKIVQ